MPTEGELENGGHGGDYGRISDVPETISRRIRRASMIVPATGERIRNALTFARWRRGSENGHADNRDSEQAEPLLGSHRRSNSNAAMKLSKIRMRTRKFTDWLESQRAHLVLKCSIAYLIGSMTTFAGPIAALLGKSGGKHLVATCTVYFHPARSRGSMHQATFFALVALAYSVVVSAASMEVSTLFHKMNQPALGHAVVLVVFCAGAFSLTGYTKVKMANPTVNVACSLTSIHIITTLVLEGNVQMGRFSSTKINQTTAMVFMAIVVSTTLANVLWATSAVYELRKAMVKSNDSFAEMISTITRSFLRGSEESLLRPSFIQSAANYRAVFTTLAKHLKEAKWEHYVKGTEQIFQLETELVHCMQRLAQNLGGLQSAATTQFTLLRQAQTQTYGRISESMAIGNGSSTQMQLFQPRSMFSPPLAEPGNGTPIVSWLPASLPNIAESSSSVAAAAAAGSSPGLAEDGQPQELITHQTLFNEFIAHLGPSMKSLAMTVKYMLDDLPFGPPPRYIVSVNSNFEPSLRRALDLYSTTSIEALNQLYRSKALSAEKSPDDAADQEEVAASCGHFSYCLEDFAKEMFAMLDILKRLEDLQNNPQRSWNWLKFWKRATGNKTHVPARVDIDVGPDGPANKHVLNLGKGTPPFTYKIWKALRLFRLDSVRYSIKFGVGAALYALPAFIPATRPIFSHYRGEWGLVSYVIVMSMTLGATNTSGMWRILGTLVGAALAMLGWHLFPGDAVPLAAFGWFISLPCFHLLINTSKQSFGRFILLTYNITALYAYSLSVADDDDDDDDEGGLRPMMNVIAYHRVVSVMSGVIWGLIVSRYVWPISARRKLRTGLAVLWLRMAMIWKRDPLSSLTEGEIDNPYMNISEEFVLQQGLMRLETLLKEVPFEFRLKGPFPISEYRDLLASTQMMLDAFHGMSVILSKEPRASPRETDILNFTARERADLCSRIFHLFYVLSSSIRAGFPLPETLPSTENARDRLLTKLYSYRQRIRGLEGQSDADFALLYAYVLMTGRISDGLKQCERRLEELCGVLDEELLDLGE